LRGFSATRGLVFRNGLYPVDAPLLLDDGVIQLFAAAGQLEIATGELRYSRPSARSDVRAQYLFLAALVVLIVVLMARLRLRVRRP
jgi:hypothetical protein